jgi:hypothetical protein
VAPENGSTTSRHAERNDVADVQSSLQKIRSKGDAQMTFVEKNRFAGSHTEKELKISWEGEIFGSAFSRPVPRCFPSMRTS